MIYRILWYNWDWMLFNSIDFLVFFPLVTIVFFVVPKKLRYIWLLLASYFFYMCWNPHYALLMLLSTAITFIASLLIKKCKTKKMKRFWLVASLISNLAILAVFKYANFFIDNINAIVSTLGFEVSNNHLDLLLPVGISFYTFQALGYTIDVYRGTIKPERNFLRYALFVSFFPQLVAGPIERSKNLLKQIQRTEKIKVWNFVRIRDGVLLMAWGFFQKLVIADRASILVNNVINNSSEYGFLEIAIAIVLFAFQIYCDFGGYTNIARGAAKVLGFDLMHNFRQPYFATNIKNFWRRWHISLTTWFTDYIYIPLGGNRKGLVRKYLNILVVFLISGLWHGANWSFVLWGLIHAIYQITGDLKNRLMKKLGFGGHESRRKILRTIVRVLTTFVLVDFAWIFFACDNVDQSFITIGSMFSTFKTTGLSSLGLNHTNWIILIVAIVMLFIVDFMHERHRSVFEAFHKKPAFLKWVIYVLLVWFIILLGIYGVNYDAGSFIYFQF